MASNPVKIVVGTGNRHKFDEIRAILAELKHIELVPLSAYPGVPPIEENEKTFEGNSKKKALELARFLRLAGNVSYANQSTAADDDDETDFEALSAKRHREVSSRRKAVKLTSSGRMEAVPPPDYDVLVMADDSGLEVDALNGAPGVTSARYAGRHGDDSANNRLLLENLKGVPTEKRRARFVCTIALAWPDGVLISTRGTVEGRIINELKGKGGFGYDPLFFYPPLGKTFGEIEAETKNKLSHRHNALTNFKVELQKLLKA
ncbi:MAG: non-canonical purine NTP pyrophosphatase [Planctomycetes bacterium]|nr:non-canonical purine NTP pyrophosphatase [Planctomycetota bacterium]